MTVAETIQFTTQQARIIAGVSPEAWRHWRKNLPYVQGKKGKAARFSIGEIVALCAVEEAVNTFGIRLTKLSDSFDQIFRTCAAMSPRKLRDYSLIIQPGEGTVTETSLVQHLRKTAIIIPCAPIIDQVWKATFHENSDGHQRNLPFPPSAVAGGPT